MLEPLPEKLERALDRSLAPSEKETETDETLHRLFCPTCFPIQL